MHTRNVNVKTAAQESTGRWVKKMARIIDRGHYNAPVRRRLMRITEISSPVPMPVCTSSVAHCQKLLINFDSEGNEYDT